MIDVPKTCMACRVRIAVKKTRDSHQRVQWRCAICFEQKNNFGFNLKGRK
jgi:hypothetical protein